MFTIRFPALVALGEHVWLDNRDERFAAGLDVLIARLARPRQPGAPAGPRRQALRDMTAHDHPTA